MEMIEFGSIMTLEKGRKPVKQSKQALPGYAPYVDIKTFETGKVDNYTNGEKCLPCDDNDILIVCDGSRSGLVGKAIKGYVGSTLAKISAKGMSPDYLYYFLQGKYQLLNTRKKGTGTPHLNIEMLKKQKLIIPSYDEQKQIVSKIEELFSSLNNAEETLIKTRKKLGIYRKAILKKTFDFNQCDHVELREIVDEIRIGPFGTMLHKSDYQTNGIPVINPQHIYGLSIHPGEKNTISKEKSEELSAYKLLPNDIIMGRRGEMGRTAPITKNEDGWICGTGSMIIRLKKEYDATLYAKILSSPDVVKYLEDNATGTTMKNLNEKIVEHIPVPIISTNTQLQLTSDLDDTISICENIEEIISNALQKTKITRQSILKEAFEGRLV